MSSTTPAPNPVDELARDVSNLQTELNTLQSKVRLNDVSDRVEDLESRLQSLPNRIRELRQRGYAFNKAVETQATQMLTHWATMRGTVRTQIQSQSRTLLNDLPPIESKMAHLATLSRNLSLGRPYYAQVKSEIESLESRASAAASSISGMYDEFETQFSKLSSHLNRIEWTITQLGQACFQLLPTEAVIMAVKARWMTGPKKDDDDPEGNFYLTDQRIIFEQKQEIATKKVLFITTERKLVQTLKFEIALALVQEVTPTKQGVFKNEDHLDIRFAVGAPYQTIHLHLDGQDCKEWQELIQRARSKEFDKDRAIEIDPAEIEKVKSAPTKCPSCNATIEKPILRGQDTITCDYCGTVIRL